MPEPLPIKSNPPPREIKHEKKVCFTGTRHGMTASQRQAFTAWIESEHPDQFFHGACVGSDEQSVQVARDVFDQWIYIVACPGFFMKGGQHENGGIRGEPKERSQIAMRLSDLKMGPQTHLLRNRHMVLTTHEVVATPWQGRELEPPMGKTGIGGTWYTIQYALKLGKKVTIIWPNGDIEVRPAVTKEEALNVVH